MGMLPTFMGQFYDIAIADLKFVGTLCPAARLIGDILDFSVLDVTVWQPLQNCVLV